MCACFCVALLFHIEYHLFVPCTNENHTMRTIRIVSTFQQNTLHTTVFSLVLGSLKYVIRLLRLCSVWRSFSNVLTKLSNRLCLSACYAMGEIESEGCGVRVRAGMRVMWVDENECKRLVLVMFRLCFRVR